MDAQGLSLSAVDLMVNISAEYPLLYTFLLALCALLGFLFCGYTLLLLVRVNVFQTVSAQQFNWGMAIPALMFGTMLIALPYTMYVTSGSLLDHGYGSLFPPEAVTTELRSAPMKMLGMFAEQTTRFIGWFFGAWGLIDAYSSRMPEGDKDKLWGGLLRVGLGSILILSRDFGNLFGGMGDRIFG